MKDPLSTFTTLNERVRHVRLILVYIQNRALMALSTQTSRTTVLDTVEAEHYLIL